MSAEGVGLDDAGAPGAALGRGDEDILHGGPRCRHVQPHRVVEEQRLVGDGRASGRQHCVVRV